MSLTYILEKAMTRYSSTLAWKIPWAEEPGRLQSMGSLRVRHNWATHFSLSCIGEGNGNPLQCSCLENPRDRGAWWAAVYGVAQSRARLKRLSSSNIYICFPCCSAGKESACNVGVLGSEDLLEKGKATHFSIWPWEFHGLYKIIILILRGIFLYFRLDTFS